MKVGVGVAVDHKIFYESLSAISHYFACAGFLVLMQALFLLHEKESLGMKLRRGGGEGCRCTCCVYQVSMEKLPGLHGKTSDSVG